MSIIVTRHDHIIGPDAGIEKRRRTDVVEHVDVEAHPDLGRRAQRRRLVRPKRDVALPRERACGVDAALHERVEVDGLDVGLRLVVAVVHLVELEPRRDELVGLVQERRRQADVVLDRRELTLELGRGLGVGRGDGLDDVLEHEHGGRVLVAELVRELAEDLLLDLELVVLGDEFGDVLADDDVALAALAVHRARRVAHELQLVPALVAPADVRAAARPPGRRRRRDGVVADDP
mmetsp:Transcript_5292/g.21829  ORF Transcript_5292/g.21829 Transcript_5292/m.21829 type:complete len:234 (-) Transcript_5292:1324-2025(-)